PSNKVEWLLGDWRIHHDLPLHAGVDRAVVRDRRALSAGVHCEACPRDHDAGVEAAIVGDNAVQQLIVVVNGDRWAAPLVWRSWSRRRWAQRKDPALSSRLQQHERRGKSGCSASFARQAWLEISWFRGDVSA